MEASISDYVIIIQTHEHFFMCFVLFKNKGNESIKKGNQAIQYYGF